MPINKDVLTKEQIAKAMSCETAEELMALAKAEGVELTKEEAEAPNPQSPFNIIGIQKYYLNYNY